MDRPSTSTNPLFIGQDDDMNSYVTKSHLFGAQRALHQEQQAMSERIDNLATDLRLSEQRTRDYFDHKLDDHKQENDARMDKIRALLLNHSSSTSSSSRRSRSNRHSDFTLPAQVPQHRTLFVVLRATIVKQASILYAITTLKSTNTAKTKLPLCKHENGNDNATTKSKSECVYTKKHKMPRHNVKSNNCEMLKHLRCNKPSEIQVEL